MEKILITGASGYIGSMLVKHILSEDSGAEITAPLRRTAGTRLPASDRLRIIKMDLSEKSALDSLAPDCSYIIHCACATKSSEMAAHPVETAAGILSITENVLYYAKRCRESGALKSMVYLSSMEVYGNIDCSDGHRAAEDEMGYINPLAARSCYPLGKRMAENLCYSYFKEYGVPVKIARLAQTFGHGVLLDDSRVFAQFARAAAEGRDIVLHTEGKSMGNYCGIDDAVKGILTILRRGADGEAYNVVNETNTMSIREMAELVAEKLAKGQIKVVCDIPKDNVYGYAPDTGLRLSGRKLMGLGWMPAQDLAEMYRDAAEDMAAQGAAP